MRGALVRQKWIVPATVAGALALGALAVAGPALAEQDGAGGTRVVERITDALAGLVDDGSLTQQQADEVATTLAESGLGGSGGHRGGSDLTAAAEVLGMSGEELRSALAADGATLAQVAD